MTDRPHDRFEEAAYRAGCRLVAGADEVGRGPLAGPVVAAAVILPRGAAPFGLRDSKQLTPQQRSGLYAALSEQAVSIGVGVVSASLIDRVNILEATRLAMLQAVGRLRPLPDYLLVDALDLPALRIRQQAVIKGDQRSLSVAAASVVAKVTRDRMMARYHGLYPEYGFLAHKGYPTWSHLKALATYGPCPIHRRTFRGVIQTPAPPPQADQAESSI